MRQIRNNVFETNSSSTHSLTMCSEDEYNKWCANAESYENGQLFLYDGIGYSIKENCFYTLDEAVNVIDKYNEEHGYKKISDDPNITIKEKIEILQEEGFYTSDEFFNMSDLETFEESYTTKSGEKVIAFGKYGYDG